MAVMLMAQAFNVNVGSAGKKLVLLKLADNANDNGECWPSYQHIADQCEISKRSAMNYINELIADGLVQKKLRKGPKGNSTNVYIVTLGGERAAPPSEIPAPHGEPAAPDSESAAPGGSEPAAPGISHSSESVSESVTCSSEETDSPEEKLLPLICKDKSEYHVDPEFVAEMELSHPKVNVSAELVAMRAWLLSNPDRRKTRSGMKRFINSWLSRASRALAGKSGKVCSFRDHQAARIQRTKIFPGTNPPLRDGEWIEDGYICREVSA